MGFSSKLPYGSIVKSFAFFDRRIFVEYYDNYFGWISFDVSSSAEVAVGLPAESCGFQAYTKAGAIFWNYVEVPEPGSRFVRFFRVSPGGRPAEEVDTASLLAMRVAWSDGIVSVAWGDDGVFVGNCDNHGLVEKRGAVRIGDESLKFLGADGEGVTILNPSEGEIKLFNWKGKLKASSTRGGELAGYHPVQWLQVADSMGGGGIACLRHRRKFSLVRFGRGLKEILWVKVVPWEGGYFEIIGEHLFYNAGVLSQSEWAIDSGFGEPGLGFIYRISDGERVTSLFVGESPCIGSWAGKLVHLPKPRLLRVSSIG